MPSSPSPKPSGIYAALPHSTSRSYASNAITSGNPDWANQVLMAAASGEEVDVWNFLKALTHAMSAATTRYGHSMSRREAARQIRHLSYWAEAIIEARLLDLPPVEPAARSPRIAALEDEVSGLQSQVENLQAARAVLMSRLAAAEEQSLAGRVDLQGQLCNEKDRVNALIREKTSVEAELAEVKRLGEYAMSLLTDSQVERVLGYIDGLNDRDDAASE